MFPFFGPSLASILLLAPSVIAGPLAEAYREKLGGNRTYVAANASAVVGFITRGEIDKLNQAITNGFPATEPMNDGRTPLHFAAEAGQTQAAEALLRAGARVNAQDTSGRTALMNAVQKESLELVVLLLERGADINAQDKGGDTALGRAAFAGNRRITELLLARKPRLDFVTREGSGLLTLALSGRAKADYFKWLLETTDLPPRNPVGKSKYSQEPLVVAVRTRRAAEAEFLALKGARADLGVPGKAPLIFLAISTQEPAIVRAMIKARANLKALDPETQLDPMHFVFGACQAWRGSQASCVIDLLEALLEGGGSLEATDPQGLTILMTAIETRDPDLVNWVLDRAPALNAQDISGRTALMHAANWSKSKNQIERLLKQGADPAIRDRASNTALEWAVKANNKDAIELLKGLVNKI